MGRAARTQRVRELSSLTGGSFPRLIRSGPIPIGGFEEGEFKAGSPTGEVAVQVCLRGADAVQLGAQEIDEAAKIGIVVQRDPLGVHEIGRQRLRRAGGPVEIEPAWGRKAALLGWFLASLDCGHAGGPRSEAARVRGRTYCISTLTRRLSGATQFATSQVGECPENGRLSCRCSSRKVDLHASTWRADWPGRIAERTGQSLCE